jgi:hypothetical protein
LASIVDRSVAAALTSCGSLSVGID